MHVDGIKTNKLHSQLTTKQQTLLQDCSSHDNPASWHPIRHTFQHRLQEETVHVDTSFLLSQNWMDPIDPTTSGMLLVKRFW